MYIFIDYVDLVTYNSMARICELLTYEMSFEFKNLVFFQEGNLFDCEKEAYI